MAIEVPTGRLGRPSYILIKCHKPPKMNNSTSIEWYQNNMTASLLTE